MSGIEPAMVSSQVRRVDSCSSKSGNCGKQMTHKSFIGGASITYDGPLSESRRVHNLNHDVVSHYVQTARWRLSMVDIRGWLEGGRITKLNSLPGHPRRCTSTAPAVPAG